MAVVGSMPILSGRVSAAKGGLSSDVIRGCTFMFRSYSISVGLLIRGGISRCPASSMLLGGTHFLCQGRRVK